MYLTLPCSQLIAKLENEKATKRANLVAATNRVDNAKKAADQSCSASDAKRKEVQLLTTSYKNSVVIVNTRSEEHKTISGLAASALKAYTDFQASFESEKATMASIAQFFNGGMKCSAAMGSDAEKDQDALPSCSAIYKARRSAGHNIESIKSGLYTIKPTSSSMPLKVYCDMSEMGGFTLVATVANADAEHWTYNAANGNQGQLSSLWENGATLGTVSLDTPTTNADFKSEAFNSLKASRILIKFKGQNLLVTQSCLSSSLHTTFNNFKFACGGSEAMNGESKVCGHSCPIQNSWPVGGEPTLLRGSAAGFLYLKGMLHFSAQFLFINAS